MREAPFGKREQRESNHLSTFWADANKVTAGQKLIQVARKVNCVFIFHGFEFGGQGSFRTGCADCGFNWQIVQFVYTHCVTKTGEDEEDAGVVPIIQPLRKMLEAIRPQNAYGFMFGNTIGGTLDLDNLADRVIKPVLKLNGLVWKGWHAYRRGLATNLKRLGVDDMVIQAILRHENVSTTQDSYIKTVRADVTAAMKRLEAKIECAAVVQQ